VCFPPRGALRKGASERVQRRKQKKNVISGHEHSRNAGSGSKRGIKGLTTRKRFDIKIQLRVRGSSTTRRKIESSKSGGEKGGVPP